MNLQPIQLTVPVHTYAGPKQPDMIAPFRYVSETPEQLEHIAEVSIKQAWSLTFESLQNVSLSQKLIEYSESMVKMVQEKI